MTLTSLVVWVVLYGIGFMVYNHTSMDWQYFVAVIAGAIMSEVDNVIKGRFK